MLLCSWRQLQTFSCRNREREAHYRQKDTSAASTFLDGCTRRHWQSTQNGKYEIKQCWVNHEFMGSYNSGFINSLWVHGRLAYVFSMLPGKKTIFAQKIINQYERTHRLTRTVSVTGFWILQSLSTTAIRPTLMKLLWLLSNIFMD
jgi:hypothetical protein